MPKSSRFPRLSSKFCLVQSDAPCQPLGIIRVILSRPAEHWVFRKEDSSQAVRISFSERKVDSIHAFRSTPARPSGYRLPRVIGALWRPDVLLPLSSFNSILR